jgi:predicted nucleotidyltransferase
MEEKINQSSPFERLRAKHSKEWPAIAGARDLTVQRFRELSPLEKPLSENTAMVVFGSFARGELTSGSDIDWSLLIDGPSDPEHFRVAQEVRKTLEALKLPEPGTTETFGTLASSHELIHHVGGVRDTNQNMTRRVLLLLESRAVNGNIVHGRVVRGILNRYIVRDASVSWRYEPRWIVPRFLLNDVVRFWRTMAVDNAAKRWEQADKKWALRNSKLRMSRKLLFAAGLIMCFNFELHPPSDRSEILADAENLPARLAEFFFNQMQYAPIDIVSQALLRTSNVEIASDILDTYDDFLAILDDEEKRLYLADLKFDEAGRDPLFQEIGTLSDRFQRGLVRLFFDDDPTLRDLAVNYGVF